MPRSFVYKCEPISGTEWRMLHTPGAQLWRKVSAINVAVFSLYVLSLSLSQLCSTGMLVCFFALFVSSYMPLLFPTRSWSLVIRRWSGGSRKASQQAVSHISPPHTRIADNDRANIALDFPIDVDLLLRYEQSRRVQPLSNLLFFNIYSALFSTFFLTEHKQQRGFLSFWIFAYKIEIQKKKQRSFLSTGRSWSLLLWKNGMSVWNFWQ